VEKFQRPYNGKKFSLDHAKIPLCFVNLGAEVSYDKILPVLNLGEHSSNPEFLASVSTMNFSPGWGKARIGAAHKAPFSVWKASSTT
jgi:hypothetical protein